tara:strand:- start:8102 stop:9907 length:1806 start_codon:yes stop_codon:yes gene_type:complete
VGFNLGRELNKLKNNVFDVAKDVAPYALAAAPFVGYYGIPGAASSMLGSTGKGAKLLEMLKMAEGSKFMNSAVGMGIKEAGKQYALSSVMGADNPEQAAKRAFYSSFPYSYLKTGGDFSQMMGNAPETDINDFMKEVSFDVPGETTFNPAGNVMPKVSYMPDGYNTLDQASSIRPGVDGVLREQSLPFLRDDYKGMSFNNNYNLGAFEDQMDAIKPLNMVTGPSETFTKNIMPGGVEGFEAFEEAREPALSGFDYTMREKEAPSIFDTILKREPPTGVEAGSDAYNKFYGIGKKEIDPYYMLKTLFDTMGGGPTEGDLAEMEEEDYQKLLKRMAITPYGSLDGFLGYNKGGAVRKFNTGGINGMVQGDENLEYLYNLFANLATQQNNDAMAGESTVEEVMRDPNGAAMEETMTTDVAMNDPGQFTDPMAGDDFNVDVQEMINQPGLEDLQGLEDYLGNMDMASNDAGMPIDIDYMREILMGPYNHMIGGMSGREIMDMDDDAIKEIYDELNSKYMATGGRAQYNMGGMELNGMPGGAIRGPGTEKSDSIPAQLSNNEFVMTAEAVRAAGGGDIDAGAQKLYGIMNALDPNSAKPNDPPEYA